MKRAVFGILMFAACLCFFGCHSVEPEEVYLISALGFDLAESGVRVVAEVPLTRENEADKMEVQVFEGVGKSIPLALERMKSGLSKKLEFGHCALAVLGNGIEGARLEEAVDCLCQWQVPLSATVVYSPDARELLTKGSLSGPAVGYEIPDVLQLISKERDIRFCCRIYEVISAGDCFELPRFLPWSGETAQMDLFDGKCVYREKKAVEIA